MPARHRISASRIHNQTPNWRIKPIQLAAMAALAVAASAPLHAADSTWTNGAGTFVWNTGDLNWSSGAWSNAAGDGAVFGGAGAGAINVTVPISVNSLDFTANGYTLGGAGSLTFVAGASTRGTGFVGVSPGVTASINTAINSSLGLLKIGAGTLQLGGPLSFSGNGLQYFPDGRFAMDLIVAGAANNANGDTFGGTVRIMNSSVLPATTRVGISNGLLDLGSNNVALGSLLFINQASSSTWDPVTRSGGVGVIGTGTLRLTGEINVIGVNTNNNGSNNIGVNLDLGGGTQIVRTAVNGSFALGRALQISGVISNGSLLKTYGLTENGSMGQPDGLSLFGNNTYAGSTVLNGGPTLVSGTNASTSVKVVGAQPLGLGLPGTQVYLFGADGSYLSATTLQASAAGQIVIDNNFGIAAGSDSPTIAAAQNNNRLRDDAEMRLRDGTFSYIARSGVAGSETVGSLNLLGGHNVVGLTRSGTGGTATVTFAGNLTMAPRATMQVSSTTLGTTSQLFVNGTLPAADATGILPRTIGSSDFLTYNANTGLTPYTGYATDFSTAGTNVAVTAASTVASSVNINALKRTGSFTTTIGAGQTLGINSGMIFSTSGTGTFTGGTIALGAAPGVFFGTNVVNSAITGSAGLLQAAGALTLNGDLSGLSGTITANGVQGFMTLATNTFSGDLELRAGTLNINTSQTLAGQGAIRIGMPESDSNLVASIPVLRFSGAGANAVIGRDIIVDNGSQNAAGLAFSFGFLPSLAPLSNATSVQTLSGNITLNSPIKLQGGGSAQILNGSTNFTGNISGPALFDVANGRAIFSGNVGNAGGFRIGEAGFTAQVVFSGTTTGSAPVTFVGGNSSSLSYMAGSLPTGQLTIDNGSGLTGFSATVIPLATSTIANVISLGGIATANAGAGIVATWSGPVGGSGALTKNGTGTLVLGNAVNTYTGATTVNAGTLLVQGASASSAITVANTGTLGGGGNLSGFVTVATGGTLAPGNSIGTLAIGGMSLSGTLLTEIDLNGGGAAAADLLDVTGFFGITVGGRLSLALANLPAVAFDGTYLLGSNDGTDAISGTFGSIVGLPDGYLATVNYAFNGVDSLGRVGTGNDLAVNISAVPEPTPLALLGTGGAFLIWLRRRRRTA